MTHPYSDKPARQYWKSGVRSQSVFNIDNLYTKKFELLSSDKIATGGSCFAQHISKRLMNSGYNFIDVEPAPDIIPSDVRKSFGFDTYSARYGNIYTARQLLELAKEAFGYISSIYEPWERSSRFFDPIRPNIELEGFVSSDEYRTARQFHLKKVRELFETMDVFVFTLGLTEYWYCNSSNRALPIAPGVIAGDYNHKLYSLKNQECSEVVGDFQSFMTLIEKHRTKRCKFLLTVSPVPLAATAEDQHVLVSNTYSKSVLRAAAGQLFKNFSNVDYFPSYELITSPWFKGMFYDVDQRSIVDEGVDVVMKSFFKEHPPIASNSSIDIESDINSTGNQVLPENNNLDEPTCEESLLEGFSK